MIIVGKSAPLIIFGEYRMLVMTVRCSAFNHMGMTYD